LNRVIIGVAGIACQAFALFEQICREYGNVTLGDLSKRLSNGYWLVWRVQP